MIVSVAAFATALLAVAPMPARAGEVALTFDDLPIYGDQRPIGPSRALTEKLLGGLTRHRLKAIGFVNEGQLATPDRAERIDLLRRWLDAGMDLGNHGYSHLSLSHTPLDAYIADARKGEKVTSELLAARGRKERWYRYPFLETGQTIAIRRGFETWLAGHGFRVAPVTMENADWQFGDAYDHALEKHDLARARWVRAAYLDYSAKAFAWYRAASVAVFGREIRFVLLMHASQLNADSIDALAEELRHQHLRSVSLSRAVADPAYKTPDTVPDASGDEWLTRWSQSLHRTLPYDRLPQVPPSIEAESPG